MKYAKNIESMAELCPDYMGFIFYEKSPRHLSTDIPKISEDIKKTGVFVDATKQLIKEKIKTHKLSAIQLHGKESPLFCEELMQENIEIIKAFSVDENFDFETMERYLKVCDYFLLDSKGKNPGGNGFAFDWSILQKYPYSKPFFLSGGISAENRESVLELTKETKLPIYAIDINSKFEIKPGLKDINLIKQFIK